MLVKTTTSPAHAKQPQQTTTVSEFQGGLFKKLTEKASHGYMDAEDDAGNSGTEDVVLSSRREASFQSGLRIVGDEHKLTVRHGADKQEVYAKLNLSPENGSVTLERESQKLTVCDNGAIYLERQGSNGPVPEQFRIQDGQVHGMINNYYGSYTPVEGSVDAQGKLHVHSIMDPANSGERVIETMVPVSWFVAR